ncbi:MAG: DUF3179 domain-containing protein [Chitinophagales bacterium]|nr:DUF3179 domain-containing protein [Chitinophagales bacterium]
MHKRLSSFLFIGGILLLIVPDAIVFYLIMPVPTSQHSDQIAAGHFLYQTLWYARILGLLCVLPLIIRTWKRGRLISIGFTTGILAIAVVLVYLLGFRYMPENVFKEPETLLFAPPSGNTIPLNNYVLGIVMNGEAKAYPLKFVGYHHKIQDLVGGAPVLVTYCTMCRTAMAYDPVINGKREKFRLVGAAFNNAVIEDETTKSWWYQSTGIAGAGPLKGTALKTIPVEQMTLATWISEHPNTLIMQADPAFTTQYAKLRNYDINVPAANTDPSRNKSFLPNSWVIGVIAGDSSAVFLWNELTTKKIINTVVDTQPIVIVLQQDGFSYHAFKSSMDGVALTFTQLNDSLITDQQTNSAWSLKGECSGGQYAGKKLVSIAAYQTYYHSWERFYGNKHKNAPYSISNNKFLNAPSAGKH